MGINKIVYKNIRIQMAAKKLSVRVMAEQMGIPKDTLSRKLDGFAAFKLEEAILLKNACFPDCQLEYLFEELYKQKE